MKKSINEIHIPYVLCLLLALLVSSSYSPSLAGPTQSSNNSLSQEQQPRLAIHCHNKPLLNSKKLHGKYWVLQNYVRAKQRHVQCNSSVTLTTHADFRYLDNLAPLVRRWRAPVSLALYAPGTDFRRTLESINWLCKCSADRKLLRWHVSFHIYFHVTQMPQSLPPSAQAMRLKVNCHQQAPFLNVPNHLVYRVGKGLFYPINVGRNVARAAATTHYVLATNIELYPTPGLEQRFFAMLARQPQLMNHSKPLVFALPSFELSATASLPRNKTQLQKLWAKGKAWPSQGSGFPIYHNGPKLLDWLRANDSATLDVYQMTPYSGSRNRWYPVYIGTRTDPHYDERLHWETWSDQMMHVYTLCLLEYEFHILDNAFLVHKPASRPSLIRNNRWRLFLASKTYWWIRRYYLQELLVLYGDRPGCYI